MIRFALTHCTGVYLTFYELKGVCYISEVPSLELVDSIKGLIIFEINGNIKRVACVFEQHILLREKSHLIMFQKN